MSHVFICLYITVVYLRSEDAIIGVSITDKTKNTLSVTINLEFLIDTKTFIIIQYLDYNINEVQLCTETGDILELNKTLVSQGVKNRSKLYGRNKEGE